MGGGGRWKNLCLKLILQISTGHLEAALGARAPGRPITEGEVLLAERIRRFDVLPQLFFHSLSK